MLSEGTKIRDFTIVRPPWMSSDAHICSVNIGMMADSYMAVDASGNTVLLKCYKCPAPTDRWIDAYAAYQQELRRTVEGDAELQALTCRAVDFFRYNVVGKSVASDVFTCGLMLYELLTRDGNPYGGLELEECKRKVMGFAAPEPVLIASRAADADAKVRAVVRACLDPDPDARPTAHEVERVLAAWQKSN